MMFIMNITGLYGKFIRLPGKTVNAEIRTGKNVKGTAAYADTERKEMKYH